MRVEIVIPIILCLFLLMVCTVGYFVYKRKAPVTISVIFCLLISFMTYSSCSYLYHMNERKLATEQAKDLEKLESVMPNNQNDSAVANTFNAKAVTKNLLDSPKQAMSALKNKIVPIQNMYFLSSIEHGGKQIHVFSAYPGGNAKANKNLMFFCMTINKDIDAEIAKLSPVNPVTVIIEPVDLQEVNRDGKSLIVCMSVMHGIIYK